MTTRRTLIILGIFITALVLSYFCYLKDYMLYLLIMRLVG
jgi:hypothetical protein